MRLLLPSILACLSLPAPAAAQLSVQPAVTGLERPVRLVAPPGDDRLFVVQKTGLIRVFDLDGSDRGVFLDLSDSLTVPLDSEQGLLGLAFAPDHATSGRFYVNFTDAAGDTRVMRFLTGPDPDVADPGSGTLVLAVEQPYANHNAGHLDFGPDGMLYVGLGDGGSFGDPGDRAQDPRQLLGKMLRLDVSGPSGYAVPADNPFVGQAPRDEIWALGLRNPWCFDFDDVTGDLYIADVGQDTWEEIDVQPAGAAGGANYGWRLMEGNDCYNPPTNCDPGGLTLPVHQYGHGAGVGCSISGGYVYRGTAIAALQGRYLFADFCTDRIWSLRWTAQGGLQDVAEHTAELTPPGGYAGIAAFGQDGRGELYVLDHVGGTAYRIVTPASGVPGAGRQGLRLRQNVPNPFNPRTTLTFALDAPGPATLAVYDAAGRRVRTLAQAASLPAGPHDRTWDGRDAGGRPVAAGVYFARLAGGGAVATRRMVLVR